MIDLLTDEAKFILNHISYKFRIGNGYIEYRELLKYFYNNDSLFIQIEQYKPGEAILLISTPDVFDQVNFAELFDSINVEISFSYKIFKSPIRTKMGKIPLLVKVDSTE